MTDLQKVEYWKTVNGKYVQWTGKIVEVTEKTVSVKSESDTFIDDFGATIIKEQRESLINMKKCPCVRNIHVYLNKCECLNFHVCF
jgi:hypothetical protein